MSGRISCCCHIAAITRSVILALVLPAIAAACLLGIARGGLPARRQPSASLALSR